MTHVKHTSTGSLWTTDIRLVPVHRVNLSSTFVTKGLTPIATVPPLWIVGRSPTPGRTFVHALGKTLFVELRPSALLIVLHEGERVAGPKPIDAVRPPRALGLGTDL